MNTLYISDSSVDGLKNGAKITAIDGHFVNNYDKLQLELIKWAHSLQIINLHLLQL